MKKYIISLGFVLIILDIFGQPGCVKSEANYNPPDNGKVIFLDSGESKIVITNHEKGLDFLYKKETTYFIFEDYLVKSEKSTKYLIGTNGEGVGSYALTFFKMPNYEKAFTCTKDADRFEPKDSYFLSRKIGCCEYSDYYELSTFPANETFLTYHGNKLEVHAKRADKCNPDKKYVIYFGFNMCPYYQDTTETVLGALNYSINQNINGSVVFKKKNPKDNIGYAGYTPVKFQLIENGKPIGEPVNRYGNDVIAHADNLSFLKNYSEINNLGIIVTFMYWEKGKNAQQLEKDFKVEFVNGAILENEIIVEF